MSETVDAEIPGAGPDAPPPPTLTIALKEPMRGQDGNDVFELLLSEPSAGKVQAAELNLGDGNGGLRAGRTYQVALISAVTKVEPGEVDKLGMASFMEAVRFLNGWVAWNTVAPEKRHPEMQDRGGMLINLDREYTGGGHVVDQLNLQEITLAQMKKAETFLKDYSPNRVRGYQIALVAQSSGVSSGIILQLPVSVVNLAAAYVQGFSQGGPATGGTSSPL